MTLLLKMLVQVQIVLAVFATLGFLYSNWERLFTPHELGYGEGIVLYQCGKITEAGMAYPRLEDYPHIVFHYPPVYCYASRVVSGSGLDLLLAGRVVSYLSMVGIAALAAALAWAAIPTRFGNLARSAGASMVALSFGLRSVLGWTPQMRVDLLGLFLVFAGVYLFVRGRRMAAFVLFVLALYTKQTFLAAPAACLVVAGLIGLPLFRRLLAGSLALGLAIMAAYMWWTGGQFARHLVLYNVNPFSLRLMLELWWQNFLEMRWTLCLAFPLACAVLYKLFEVLRKRSFDSIRARLEHSVLHRAVFAGSLHWLFSLILTAGVGKQGSDFNYFLEWDLVSCWLAGVFLAILIWQAGKSRRAALIAVPALLLPIAVLLEMAPTAARAFKPSSLAQEQTAAIRGIYQDLYRTVASIPGPIISQDMTVLVQNGKELPFEPEIIRHLINVGRFDETGLVRRIESGKFGAVILHSSLDFLFSPRMAAAVRQTYEERQTIGQFRIYRPRGAP